MVSKIEKDIRTVKNLIQKADGEMRSQLLWRLDELNKQKRKIK